MSIIEIKPKNILESINFLTELEESFDTENTEALKEWSAPIVNEQKNQSDRYETGFMNNNTYVRISTNKAEFRSDARYTGYQDKGTSRGIEPSNHWSGPLLRGMPRIREYIRRRYQMLIPRLISKHAKGV